MKKLICLGLCLSLLSSFCPVLAGESPACGAQSCVLLHPETGAVLYAKDAEAALPMASTTKLMTALVVLERAALSDTVVITPEMAAVEGSSMYLTPGASYTVEELLYGLLLVSGNDAAQALACHVAGSMKGFVVLMNDKAAELGLAGTHFVNAHGLDAPGHYSCALDLARLMAACLACPGFAEISGARTYPCRGMTLVNHNKLLWSCPGVLCGKTGYTVASGRSLVTAWEQDGLLLVCATLNDRTDWVDHAALYAWAGEKWQAVRLEAGTAARAVPVVSGETDSLTAVYGASAVLLAPGEAEVTRTLCLPDFLFAGVQAGDSAGSAVIRAGDGSVTLPLVWGTDAPQDESQRLSRWERFKRVWYMVCRYSGTWYVSPR